MLIRRRSRQDVTEARWRAEVSAKLDLLMDAQAQMASVASLQLKDRERQRPGRLAWTHAILVLVLSGSVVFSGVVVGTAATSLASDASSLQGLANSAMTQVDEATRPVISLVNSKGPKWVYAHATKAELNDLTTAEWWAKAYRTDSDQASADQRVADRGQLAGPALLAFGSALCGAVLGWMLMQWLGSLRSPRKHET